MRRKICTILYKLGLRRVAYHVSPGICCMLMAKECGKYFIQGYVNGIKESKAMQTLAKAAQENGGKTWKE